MITKRIFQILLITSLSFLLVQPSQAAWPLLNEQDMQKFIQTFPSMYQEYKKLGLTVNPQTGKVEGAEKLKRDKEVARVLKENGWNFMFWPKLQTITRGYSLLKHQSFNTNHGANVENFVNNLKSAKWMTPEKKAELEAFYSNAKKGGSAREQRLKKQVNKKDLDLIKAFLPQLDSVMEQLVKIEWDDATKHLVPPVLGNPNIQDPQPQQNLDQSNVSNELIPLLGSTGPDKPSSPSSTQNSPMAQSQPSDAFTTQILGSVNSPRASVKKISIIRRDGGRIDWSPDGNTIAMDRKAPGKYYNVFVMSPNGTQEKCLTCDTGGALSKGHQGQPAWHPSGNYLVFQSQKRASVGNWGRDLAATPGFGQFCDLWLLDIRTNRFYQLTHTDSRKKTGVLHPHFSHDGTKLTWSQMYQQNGFLGTGVGDWKLKVADFSFQNGLPTLTNEQSFEPGPPSFLENHGTSPDDSKLIFTGSFEWDGKGSWFKSTRIYLLDLNTKQLQKLTDDPTWNEHALYNPASGRIVWMTGKENTGKGTDYWSMNPDGSDKRRITDYNNPSLPSFKGKSIVSADSSFSPDGTKLIAYLQTNLVTQDGLTVLIEFDEDEISEATTPIPAHSSPQETPSSPAKELASTQDILPKNVGVSPTSTDQPLSPVFEDTIDTKNGYFLSYEAAFPKPPGRDVYRFNHRQNLEWAHCTLDNSGRRKLLHCDAKKNVKQGKTVTERSVKFSINTKGFADDVSVYTYPWRSYSTNKWRNTPDEKGTEFAMDFMYNAANIGLAQGITRVDSTRPIGERYVNKECSLCTIWLKFNKNEKTVRGDFHCERLWKWPEVSEKKLDELGPLSIQGQFYLEYSEQ